MKWNNKVDDKTKEKIELLYKQFDRFIEQNHSSGSQEDSNMIRQWSNFKQVIEKGPTDFETMHQYINKMGENTNEGPPSRVSTKNTPNLSPSASSRNISEKKTDINKLKLKKASNDLLAALAKNNKEIFKV